MNQQMQSLVDKTTGALNDCLATIEASGERSLTSPEISLLSVIASCNARQEHEDHVESILKHIEQTYHLSKDDVEQAYIECYDKVISGTVLEEIIHEHGEVF